MTSISGRATRGSVLGGVLIALAILAGGCLFLFAFASLLAAQAAPGTTLGAGPEQLVPSAATALAAILGVGLTGVIVKGTTSADSWWQLKVVPKVKPVQPVVALGLSLGLGLLGQKLGIPGLQNMNDLLLQSPTATLAAIALREGAQAIAKSLPAH